MANLEQQIRNLQDQMTVLMTELNGARGLIAGLEQQVNTGAGRPQVLEAEVQTVRAENQQLRADQVATSQVLAQGNGSVAAMTAMTDEVKKLTQGVTDLVKKKDSSGEKILVDVKGIGKPEVFRNNEGKFSGWARKVENFIVSIFGEEFRAVLEWSLTQDKEVTRADWDSVFGHSADDLDRVDNLEHKISQVYQALMSLTEEEGQDLVIGAGSGNGLEAWRKVNRRWDPLIAGRRQALLKAIISPHRCKLGDLYSSWERWEEQIRRYEKSKDEDGMTEKLSNSVKMTAFMGMLPLSLIHI